MTFGRPSLFTPGISAEGPVRQNSKACFGFHTQPARDGRRVALAARTAARKRHRIVPMPTLSRYAPRAAASRLGAVRGAHGEGASTRFAEIVIWVPQVELLNNTNRTGSLRMRSTLLGIGGRRFGGPCLPMSPPRVKRKSPCWLSFEQITAAAAYVEFTRAREPESANDNAPEGLGRHPLKQPPEAIGLWCRLLISITPGGLFCHWCCLIVHSAAS